MEKKKFLLSYYEPSGRSKCLCGSGYRFKNCCKTKYVASSLNCVSLFNKGLYKKALEQTRAHITWYRLCHYAHTVNFLHSGTDEAKKMLSIDIEALSDSLGLLLNCYTKCGIILEFPAVLEEMTDAINDKRWDLKLVYHECVYYLFIKDLDSALRITKNIEWKDIYDVQLLTVFLDIMSDSLNLLDIPYIAERICSLTESADIKLQYSYFLGVYRFLINDFENGVSLCKSSIDEYESQSDNKKSQYGNFQLCFAYKNLGEMRNDNSSIEHAIELFSQEMRKEICSLAIQAQIWSEIGECYYHLENFVESERSYLRSIEIEKSGITDVFFSRPLIELGKFDLARNLLQNVNTADFSKENYFDLAISKVHLALRTKLKIDTEEAISLIKKVVTKFPFFKDMVRQILISLYESNSYKNDKKEGIFSKLNKCISLKPNFLGFGIDINAFIDCFLYKSGEGCEKTEQENNGNKPD